MYFPWIVVRLPARPGGGGPHRQGAADRHQTDKHDPDKYASEEAGDVYGDWIAIAVERWKEHVKVYGVVEEKPVLFVMAEKTKYADSIAERLRREPEFKGKDRVLVIHTDKAGRDHQEGPGQGAGGGPRHRQGEIPDPGHRQRDDAARGLGRAQRDRGPRSAAVHRQGRDPARAGHRPRPAADARGAAGQQPDPGADRHQRLRELHPRAGEGRGRHRARRSIRPNRAGGVPAGGPCPPGHRHPPDDAALRPRTTPDWQSWTR